MKGFSTPKASTRVAGHGLQAEGRSVEPHGSMYLYPYRTWHATWRLTDKKVGKALCECGEWSPELPSTAARQRWHREVHKPGVKA